MKIQLLNEIKKNGVPHFDLFKKSEALQVLPELLNELLQKEKSDFELLLQKDLSLLTFEDFITESELDYLRNLINHLDSVETLPELRQIISDFRPIFEDFLNEVAYSQAYYEKLVFANTQFHNNADQVRRFELQIQAFERRGIALSTEKQSQLKQLNKELSKLGEQFQHNVVDEQSAFTYRFPNAESLSEFPSELLEKAKKSAGEEGGFLIDADPTSLQAVMKYCTDSQIRRYFFNQMNQWASSGVFDNRPLALKMLQLTDQKAKLLGYETAGAMLLDDTMAKTPNQVFDFIRPIVAQSLQKGKSELRTLQDFFQLQSLESWDISYYTRKYKEQKYALDEEKLKEYFEFEAVLKWLHQFVFSFLGVELRRIDPDFSSVHERWYEVYKNGKLIAYYVLDAFYRKGKRPGAWADFLREKSEVKLPIILNVCNFQKSESGSSLLYLRDVETLFHEFGHALHAMLADSPYSDLSGFHVERDFVELPSQIMENWVTDPEALQTLARHYKTGEALPDMIVSTLQELKTFMKGFRVSRQNELALVDMMLYTSKVPETLSALDARILETVNQYSFFPRGEEYKMYCAFLHIFGGGYAAKYYSYMRAELLEADVFQKIKKIGIFNPEIGSAFRDLILAPGARKPASVLFFDFMQREPSSEALMEKYGLR